MGGDIVRLKSCGEVAICAPDAKPVDYRNKEGTVTAVVRQPPLGGSQPSRFERLPYFKPPALPEVSD